jgi:hypothetical protein
MTARNAICRTSMSLLSNPVPRTDRKKSSNECSPTDSHIYDPGADDGIVLAQSGHREGVGCNFRARLVEKLANVRFGECAVKPLRSWTGFQSSFAVDLKNSTVNNQPATINATAIDWQLIPGPANDTGVVSYRIDRTTGILTENFTYHLPNGSTQSDDPTTYRCTVGSARPKIPRFRR